MEIEQTSLQSELKKLLDKQAIHEVVMRIARGLDRYDGALLAACILPDAVLDMGGEKPMTGAAFAALKAPAESRPGRMHVIANELIEVEGDLACGEIYLISYQDVLRDGERYTRTRSGRYIDRYARHDGVWKLSHRTLIDEWSRMDRLAEAVPPGKHEGRPAPDDLVCSLSSTAAT